MSREDVYMNRTRFFSVWVVVIFSLFSACATIQRVTTNEDETTPDSSSGWQETFELESCTLVTVGSNPYFILEPGFQLLLEGGLERLLITVLDETVEVDGVLTRVVEEREWRNGQLIEVSRNFYAHCQENGDVYYFGEEVDMFKDGKLDSHSGAWLAGEANARAGLIMPGSPILGMKYYQEIALNVAMDRAEIVALEEPVVTPAGEFKALMTKEGTALNPLEVEYKAYAPEIGLIQDANLLLTAYGFEVDPE
jgi:hypothetical protein